MVRASSPEVVFLFFPSGMGMTDEITERIGLGQQRCAFPGVAKELCDDGVAPYRGTWREHSRSVRVSENESFEEKLVDAEERRPTVQTVHVRDVRRPRFRSSECRRETVNLRPS